MDGLDDQRGSAQRYPGCIARGCYSGDSRSNRQGLGRWRRGNIGYSCGRHRRRVLAVRALVVKQAMDHWSLTNR